MLQQQDRKTKTEELMAGKKSPLAAIFFGQIRPIGFIKKPRELKHHFSFDDLYNGVYFKVIFSKFKAKLNCE